MGYHDWVGGESCVVVYWAGYGGQGVGVGEEEWDAKGKWVRCIVGGEACERVWVVEVRSLWY